MCVTPQWEWLTLSPQLYTLSLVSKDFTIHSCLTSAISKGSDRCVAQHPQSNLSPKKYLAGDSQPLDVCSVHQVSAPLRYSVSLLGYGFYGDVLAESEKHRWMGPLRYDFSGTDCWVKWPQTVFMAVMKCDRAHMPTTSFFPVITFLCLGTMVYLCNRSYAGIVQYIPADPVLSSPRDRTRCLSG